MRIVPIKLLLILIASIIITGCGSKNSGEIKEDVTPSAQEIMVDVETNLLLEELKENGDYVNSREFPALIKASIVYENLDNNQLIIDLRSPGDFNQGHIQNAVNKRFEDLPDYLEADIKPFEYDRIILVCEDGQLSGYTTSLLRLMGYGNVYAMRWGMSAWNPETAEKGWLTGLSSSHEAEIENVENERPVALAMPELKTGLSTGAEISDSRFKKVFSEGQDHIQITADEVFADPQKYYIINYERKDKYDDGHIPGAVRYKQNVTLGFVDELATIPVDKKIVVYCGTGHNSGFVTAYLRLFGYDAHTLKYGNSSFMYDKMVKDSAQLSWLPFSSAEVNDYPLVR